MRKEDAGAGLGLEGSGPDDTEIISQSECMAHLRFLIGAVAPRTCTVLIQGETGTGKELVAREVHRQSPRAPQAFVAVDCATLRDTLLESQLFGHVRGAFTGADQTTVGFFRAADKGTLFLDEIGELPPQTQAKLLRCIQEQAVVPLGAVRPVAVDARIIAATHRDLKDMVRKGQFREDLFFRLNVVCLEVLPLRERRADIPALAQHFLKQQALLYDEEEKELSDEAAQCLLGYDWPGNVRELANVIERAFVLTPGRVIPVSVLPAEITGAGHDRSPGGIPKLDEAIRTLISQALEHTQGRKQAAARLLGVERRRFRRLLRTLDATGPGAEGEGAAYLS